MPQNFENQKRSATSRLSITAAALLTLLTTQVCLAFPVDFVLTEPGQPEQPAQVEEVKEAPGDDKAVDAVPKAAPQPRKGAVRQKVAVGAAAAAEEVGQVFGNLIGGLFGRRDAAVANVAVDKNALKQFEAQYGRHFDQTVRTELHFIRIVCQPTRQQYEAMATDGKLIRTKAINKFAAMQQGRNRGIRSNDSDTRKPISEGLLASAKRHLSADQVAAYELELAARMDADKKVALLVVAAKLDRRLVLDTPQRTQVTKVLAENWNPAWGATQMMMYGGQYFPDVPDTKITPILTATQKKVLKSVNQQSQVFWGFNVGMNQGILIPDEKWDDQPGNEASNKDEAKSEEADGEKPDRDDSAKAVDDKQATPVPEGSK